MLASMSETSWSELGMANLPTGTVTLLLADVESSTRLWETQPDAMKAAVARLDATLSDAVATHSGVRPVEQGEGDSFVVAFTRASDAVACALALQRAPLAPIRLRIGINTGEIRLRDEGNYIGPTINFFQGTGVLDIHYVPDSHPRPGTLGSGTLTVSIQGVINTSQLISNVSPFVN